MQEIGFTRFMDIYTAIDNFHDYELTNCIAYEMAVRNKKLLTLLYNLHFTTDKTQTNKILDALNKEFYFNVECVNYFNINFNFEYATIFAPELDLELIDPCTIKYYRFENKQLHFNKYSPDQHPKAVDINEKFSGFKLKTDTNSMKPELISYDFSRPELTTSKEKKSLLEINPNFQKNEILAYVEHVLDSLAKTKADESIYINGKIDEDTIQQLIENKKKSFIQQKINEKKQSPRSRLINEINLKMPQITKQNLFANQFLIYDYITYKSQKDPKTTKTAMYEHINNMLKLFTQKQFIDINGGMDAKVFKNKQKIENLLYDLYSPLDDKTMRAYFSNMKTYVEEKKYISLITF